MSMRSYEDQAWRDCNGPLWAAVEMIALLCGEIARNHAASRHGAAAR
jgi:hypothetical protein